MNPHRTGPTHKVITRNESYDGVTIEEKIERILNNGEPIRDGAPPIYTERKVGVQPAHNIRTDRFEIAIDALDSVSKGHQARRDAFHNKLDKANQKNKQNNNPGTGDNTSDNQ